MKSVLGLHRATRLHYLIFGVYCVLIMPAAKERDFYSLSENYNNLFSNCKSYRCISDYWLVHYNL